MNREVCSENSVFSLQVKKIEKILIIGKYFSHSYTRERQKIDQAATSKQKLRSLMCLLFFFFGKKKS